MNTILDPETPLLCLLGYDRSQTRVIDQLESMGFKVEHCAEPIADLSQFHLVISFGYRHILSKDTIATCKGLLVNLHISALPFNRGAHPVFWGFYDQTPQGITIHKLAPKLDQGDILWQEIISLDPVDLTFREAHALLTDRIERLLMNHIDDLIGGQVSSVPQTGAGSYHRASDLPTDFSGWDSNVHDEICRLKRCQ